MKTENLAVAFVDIVGFTPKTSAQSRVENEQMLKRFDGVVRPVVGAFGGKIVKTIGDAFLVTFRSPTDALLWGMAVHDRLAEANATIAAEDRIDIRVAVNVGEVRVEGNDVFGEAVNIASRIEGEAGAGEIYFSEAVYLVMTRSEVPTEEVGLRELKGIKDPVRLYRVPRVSQIGDYQLKGGGAGSGAAALEGGPHPLAPPALPFGGVALGKARERMSGAYKVQEVVSKAMPVVRSRSFQWAAGIGVALFGFVVFVSLVVWAWPEKKRPPTLWERIKQGPK